MTLAPLISSGMAYSWGSSGSCGEGVSGANVTAIDRSYVYMIVITLSKAILPHTGMD